MQQPCEGCGRQFESKTGKIKRCSTCRSRKSRGTVTELGETGPVSVAGSTRASLEAVDRLETPAGAAAMVLATKLDRGGDTGSAISAMVRELRATLAEALANVAVVDDPVDELRRKREERMARVGGA